MSSGGSASPYKESRVPFLGKIPDTWETRRLKYIAAINSEVLPETTDPSTEIQYVDIGSVDSLGRIDDPEKLLFKAAPSRARRVVRKGDVIVSTVRTYLRAIGGIDGSADNLIVSTGFAVIRPLKDFVPEFAPYALRASYFVDGIVASSRGVSFPAISETELGTFKVAIPPINEQREIAAFLHGRTTSIDKLISKNEGLHALLIEMKIALIRNAVMKGMNPSVAVKSCGVAWIGNLPSHWGLKPLKRVVKISGGGTPSKENPAFWPGDIPWASPKDMKVSVITETGDKITAQAVESSATKIVPQGSVLIVVRSGILRHTIPVAITGRPVALNQDIKAFVPTSELNPQYLRYMIAGLQKELLFAWKKEGATVESLEMELVSNSPTLLPPISEQLEIVKFLDHQVLELERLMSKVSEAVERLQELREALISGAVTGQIDVRAA